RRGGLGGGLERVRLAARRLARVERERGLGAERADGERELPRLGALGLLRGLERAQGRLGALLGHGERGVRHGARRLGEARAQRGIGGRSLEPRAAARLGGRLVGDVAGGARLVDAGSGGRPRRGAERGRAGDERGVDALRGARRALEEVERRAALAGLALGRSEGDERARAAGAVAAGARELERRLGALLGPLDVAREETELGLDGARRRAQARVLRLVGGRARGHGRAPRGLEVAGAARRLDGLGEDARALRGRGAETREGLRRVEEVLGAARRLAERGAEPPRDEPRARHAARVLQALVVGERRLDAGERGELVALARARAPSLEARL